MDYAGLGINGVGAACRLWQASGLCVHGYICGKRRQSLNLNGRCEEASK